MQLHYHIHIHRKVDFNRNKILRHQKQHGKHLEFSKSPNVSSNLILTNVVRLSSQDLCSHFMDSKIPRLLQELSQLMSVGGVFIASNRP